jgi:hypothetical protein
MDDTLTLDHFKPHVGKLVHLAGTRQALVLDRVEGDGKIPQGWPRAPFLVIFRGPPGRDVLVPEGSYDCEIENGPKLNLYLMPIYTPSRERQEYQSAFN